MIINKHSLIRTKDAGNGYHGICEYCGLPLVTDLGHDSWSGVKCIDRKIKLYLDIPQNIRSYAKWRGYKFDHKKGIFVKPYSNEEYTIDELNKRIKQIII